MTRRKIIMLILLFGIASLVAESQMVNPKEKKAGQDRFLLFGNSVIELRFDQNMDSTLCFSKDERLLSLNVVPCKSKQINKLPNQ